MSHLRSHPEVAARLAARAREDAAAYTWAARARRILDGVWGAP